MQLMVETEKERQKLLFSKALNRVLDGLGYSTGERGRISEFHKQIVEPIWQLKYESSRKWIKGLSMPQSSKMPVLASKLGCKTEFLYTNQGDIFDKNNTVEENHKHSSSLPDSSHISEVKSYYNVEPDIPRGEDVPLISWVSAGEFEEIIDNFEPGYAEEWMMRPKKGGSRTVAMRVRGDSMTALYGKSYPDGCVIFVDPDKRNPESGDRIVARVNGDDKVNFKQFIRDGGKVFLKPLNTSLPNIYEEFEVLGTIVGKWEDE